MKKIAFIGLGNMGLPMAVNLARKYGEKLSCFDSSSAAQKRAKAAGLSVANHDYDALEDAECVITMLPSGVDVQVFYEIAKGEASHPLPVLPNSLWLDCSTTSPEDAVHMFYEAKDQGAQFADAPVSGGIGGAQAGTLSFLVGGDKKTFARARPVLSAMGANIFHAGETGAGQAAKLCNNMMLSVQMIGVCEALSLGRKMGLDGKTLSEIMRKSSGGNWVLEKYNPLPGVMPNSPAARKYRGGFATGLMVKDSDLAMRASQNADSPVPLGALANQLFQMHLFAGNGNLDFGSILKMFDKSV